MLVWNLYVFTPTPARHRDAIRKQLLGIHDFIRNDIEYQITVEQVTIEREGLGSYRRAQQLGLLADRGYTMVIDLDGGTWLSRFAM